MRYFRIGRLAFLLIVAIGGIFIWVNLKPTEEDDASIARACAEMVAEGVPKIADEQSHRFLGKVSEAKALCRGGTNALAMRKSPWIDWGNYWGTGDSRSKSDRFEPGSHVFNRAKRGVDGALLDIELQRMELIKFNLFDNRTFDQFASDEAGPTLRKWKEMRLGPDQPGYDGLKISPEGDQLCQGDLIRFRTVTGICNDIQNPAMGASGQLFARNVAFDSTFPELELNELAKNRHAGRIGILRPDPQVISRKLFTRDQTRTPDCNHGQGLSNSKTVDCSYKKAPFFNVLAAFWIQFMTHDWFSHLDEARNDTTRILTDLGCDTERVGNHEIPLSDDRADDLGCRRGDKMEAALVADNGAPPTFKHDGDESPKRTYKTTRNQVTAWWDASQIYGWNDRSRQRAKRDPSDIAKLLLIEVHPGEHLLPSFQLPCPADPKTEDCDPIQPEWIGQEATAFPDNWSLGLSFYHNVFAREHNAIIDELRRLAKERPSEDSGLRNPSHPHDAITYGAISSGEMFEIARLVVAAEIAKIHTIEWTTQLLYDEPLNLGMNANWSGLFDDFPLMAEVSERIVKRLRESKDPRVSNQLYSALSAGAGIVGRGSDQRFPPYLPHWLSWDSWSISNPEHVNGGINHFGSPFNFTEDFASVYRLHALVPDLLEYRNLASDPNSIKERLPIVRTFRGSATDEMRKRGLANIALSMGRQRLGLLLLRNHPQFLQNLDLRPRLDTTIDVPALDLIRDRERGTPRFNEFRRQIGLRQLTSFDDFIDQRLPSGSAERAEQESLVDAIREVYGQHRCDSSKIITVAQRDSEDQPITDCLGHPNGTMVDNIEDLDLVVGIHAETTRPHGFAISETQFQIFILNASRRLYSDRFFTSSFRPEFYSRLGIDWVMNNGPTGKQWEVGEPNGHKQEVSPLKRVLLRAIPELAHELAPVINVFDPWARDRGEYYSLDWKPRPEAASDPAFAN